nr:hypothetical protein [Chitinophagaceae bacterium]
PYYNYYQHENDGAPYSSFYHKDSSDFIYYFWKNLVNLNYDNDTVQRMIIDACKYWIKEYGIDGYRFDAVWAVNARAPGFGRRLRDELRALKPDVLLLAEDKGNSDEVYKRGFDAAYDWTADTAWVSQWSWEYEHHAGKSLTVFNHPVVARRKILLEKSLFSNGHNNFRVLRFMENNDLPRFIAGHTLAQTRVAAGIMFSMPGIPMLFTGQEIGFKGHPYSRKIVFDTQKTILEQDSFGLFNYYHHLIKTRLTHAALKSSAIEEIRVPSPGVIAYARGEGKERIIVIANLDSIPARIILPGQYQHKKMSDLISGKNIRKLKEPGILVVGYGILWLAPDKKNK